MTSGPARSFPRRANTESSTGSTLSRGSVSSRPMTAAAVFVHFSAIAGDGFGTLHDGEVVVYEIDGITTNQPQARNVHALGVQSRHTA